LAKSPVRTKLLKLELFMCYENSTAVTVTEFTEDLISSLEIVLRARMDICVLRAQGRWNSIIASANMCRLVVGWSGVQITAGVRNFSVLQNDQTGSGAYQASYSMGTWV
jgi:hypothetical protein